MPPSRTLERLLPIALLAVSATSVPYLLLAAEGFPRLRALGEEKQRVDVEVSRLGDQIRRLRVEVHRMKDDPAKVERAARDELGLVRETELVFQFDR